MIKRKAGIDVLYIIQGKYVGLPSCMPEAPSTQGARKEKRSIGQLWHVHMVATTAQELQTGPQLLTYL